jgi:hypothetical protein
MYEELYVCNRADRIHFVRPCVHTLLHIGQEVLRLGPPAYCTQWTMERTIGDLGGHIAQHAAPYANLARIATRRCQLNALKAMIPALQSNETLLPRGTTELGSGHTFLRPAEDKPVPISQEEAAAIRRYMTNYNEEGQLNNPRVIRWARLRLPDGTVARAAWKELLRPVGDVRRSRIVEVSQIAFAKI